MDEQKLAILAATCAFLVVCALGFGLFVALVVRKIKRRSRAWLAAGERLGLRSHGVRRTTKALGPGIAELMRNAILVGGGNRLYGERRGRAVELVIRGETSSAQHAGGVGRPASSTPGRDDYTHVRVERTRPSGFVACSRGALEHEVARELGPPSPHGASDSRVDAILVLWARDEGAARTVLRQSAVLEALAAVSRQGLKLCFNDAWVVVEQVGAVTDPARLSECLDRALALAEALDAAS